MYKFNDLDFDKVFVSKVLQIVEEDLNVNEKDSHIKIARLRDAFETVAKKFDELLDLDYMPIDLTINEFISELRENSDDLNIDENEQIIDVLKYELIEHIDSLHGTKDLTFQ
tara:strand:- start:95 stop:430 length:336 start_codon:yes stop_codon:yes gene_type:complete